MATMRGGKKFSGAYGGKKKGNDPHSPKSKFKNATTGEMKKDNPFSKPIKDIDKGVARKIEKNVKKSFKKNKKM